MNGVSSLNNCAVNLPTRALRRGRMAWADSPPELTAAALHSLPVLRPWNASQQMMGTYELT